MGIRLAQQVIEGSTQATLVVLHGLFGSGRNWLSVARQLSRFASVVLIDLPNHGDSPHGQSLRYAHMAEAVWNTLDALGIAQPCLLGHSLGGKVAMACAAAHPEALRLLIIEDIAPLTYADRLTPTIEALRAVPLETITSRAEADVILAERLSHPTLRAFLLHGLAQTSGDWHWRFDLAAIAEGLAEVCAAPPLPWPPCALATHLIRGGLSPYVDTAGLVALQTHFRNFHDHLIPEAGHWPHAETPTAFLEHVSTILRSLPNTT